MNTKLIISFILFALLLACKDSNTNPNNHECLSGITTIFTNRDSAFFSFKAGKPIAYPFPDKITDDFIVIVSTNESGRPIGVGLFADYNSERFSYLNDDPKYETGEILFDTLSRLDDDLYYTWGIGCYEGSVIAVKTIDNKHALMLIQEAAYYRDTTDTLFESYDGYVTFKWKYQPDGSRKF